MWVTSLGRIHRESNAGMTTSDRRILMANWYFKAFWRACEGEAKRKYFEHAGALLTADGSDDNLIQLEGVPAGHTFIIP